MLSHCANLDCHKPFLALRDGKLFLMETNGPRHRRVMRRLLPSRPPRQFVERYWLCNECASRWTLVYNGDGGVELVPLHARRA